jgi:UDP-glucose 4-epimerase
LRILVTGGAGYVGSHLAAILRRAGDSVRVVDRQPAAGAVGSLQGDLAHLDVAARAVRGIDTICHLAWGFCRRDPRGELFANLLSTFNLIEAALAAGVRHLVFASTAVVYGPTGPARVDEDWPCHPEETTIGGPVYGITKLACEKLCLASRKRGLTVTVLRIHGVFSRGRLGPFDSMLRQALTGQPVRVVQEAGGEYVHLTDVLSVFRLVIGEPRGSNGTFNVAGSQTYRDSEVAHWLVEAVDSSSPIVPVSEPGQAMVSVSVDRLYQVLGWRPGQGEFLSGLIRHAAERARGGSYDAADTS